MGVWIETEDVADETNRLQSHPVWVCGLKQLTQSIGGCVVWSHPVWVCGLKQVLAGSGKAHQLSHPVWVCGLKQRNVRYIRHNQGVTPCMGVWIETDIQKDILNLS